MKKTLLMLTTVATAVAVAVLFPLPGSGQDGGPPAAGKDGGKGGFGGGKGGGGRGGGGRGGGAPAVRLVPCRNFRTAIPTCKAFGPPGPRQC